MRKLLQKTGSIVVSGKSGKYRQHGSMFCTECRGYGTFCNITREIAALKLLIKSKNEELVEYEKMQSDLKEYHDKVFTQEYQRGKKDAMLDNPPSRLTGPYYVGYQEGASVRKDRSFG